VSSVETNSSDKLGHESMIAQVFDPVTNAFALAGGVLKQYFQTS
jgi:hypothetical protein